MLNLRNLYVEVYISKLQNFMVPQLLAVYALVLMYVLFQSPFKYGKGITLWSCSWELIFDHVKICSLRVYSILSTSYVIQSSRNNRTIYRKFLLPNSIEPDYIRLSYFNIDYSCSSHYICSYSSRDLNMLSLQFRKQFWQLSQ